MVDIEDIKYVDALVQEYLLFRGFTASIRVLETEKKNDRLKGYHVPNIVSTIFALVRAGDLGGLRDVWNQLNDMFFSRLEEDMSSCVQKLDLSLKRYYVVYSIQSGHPERVLEFYRLCSTELATDKHWKSWFILPYLKSPETDPMFSVFFGKAWLDTFSLSLHNFLSTIFQSVPLPKILNFNVERKIRQSLHNLNESLMKENDTFRTRMDKLRTESDKNTRSLSAANSKIATLENQLDQHQSAQQINLLQQQVQQLQQQVLTLTQELSNYQYQKSKRFELENSSSATNTKRQTINYSIGSTDNTSNVGNPTISESRKSNPLSSIFSINSTKSPPSSSNTTSGPESPDASQSHPGLLQTSKVETFSTGNALNCCKYSPDGNFIACGTQTGTTRIWPLGNNNTHRNATIYGSAEILTLAWDQDSKLLLIGSGDGKVKVWNVAGDKSIGDITLSPYTKVRDIVCSPHGGFFACSASGLAKDSKASAIHLINSKTWTLVGKKIEFATTINSFAFNHNESLIITGGNDGYITLVAMDKREAMSSWKAHVGPVLSVAYSPDYTSIYSVGGDGKLHKWDAHSSGKLLKTYTYAGASDSARRVDVAFDSSQHYFVLPSKQEHALLYETETLTPILALGTHKGSVTCCDWHPTERQVMTGCQSGIVCLSSLVPSQSTTK